MTNPQIRKLLEKKVLLPELFDEEPLAVEYEGRRLILRCNPATRDRERQRRLDQYRRIERRLATGNERLAKKPRAKLETLRKHAQARGCGYTSARPDFGRAFRWHLAAHVRDRFLRPRIV